MLAKDPLNSEQIEFWHENAGHSWVSNQILLDRQIGPHGVLAMEKANPVQGESILDVGCGCGATTIDLSARVGPKGHVTGLDVSGPMLTRARARAVEEGLSNIEFIHADAQAFKFQSSCHDLVFSRFGVMFFADPAVAFRNFVDSLIVGGRVVFVCWQKPERNPWITVPVRAASEFIEFAAPPAIDAPGMFSLADPDRLRKLLTNAGLCELELRPETLSMNLGGGDLDAAVQFSLEVGPIAGTLAEHGNDKNVRPRVASAVRNVLAPYQSDTGVELPSEVWVVSGRKREV